MTLRFLHGNPPNLSIFNRFTIQSVSFVAPSYTISSKALTGLGKNIGFVFGGYGAFKPAKKIIRNDASLPYGTITPGTTHFPVSAPHQGIRITLLPGSFTASSYTIVSKTLTGLAKNIGFVFGGWGAFKLVKYIRLYASEINFTVAGAEIVVFVGNQGTAVFSIDGATDIEFTGPDVPHIFDIDGTTDLEFTVVGSAAFTIAGATELEFTYGLLAYFTIAGDTLVVFIAKGGQLTDCVLGGGIIDVGVAPDQNYVF